MQDATQDAAIQLAETIQTAHINHAPDRRLDVNPSTAASTKQPVEIDPFADAGAASDVDEDEVPVSILRPMERKAQMPPLPDLRFEQSYLASIKDCAGWQGVAYITVRDQVLMPLVQGLAWSLVISGWRRWNQTAQYSGQTTGAKIRRWWWGVNNWDLGAKLRDRNTAAKVEEYVVSGPADF